MKKEREKHRASHGCEAKVKKYDKEINSSKESIREADIDFAIAGRQIDNANKMRYSAAVNKAIAEHSRPQIYV